MHLKTILQSTRPSFLVLAPVCILPGFSTSFVTHSPINSFTVFLILLGAIAAHVSVNMLNEYYDFKNGLDLITEKTKFSGGSGALPVHPEMAGGVFVVGLVALLVTLLIGFYFMLERGMQVLPVGIVGVILVITYTPWLNRSPLLCLIAPGLGFGVLMVVGTQVILTGEYSELSWLVSLVPFFLVNNLLLLNQYPDIKADFSVGRNTFPIAFGVNKSNLVYGAFAFSAYALVLLYVVLGYIPSLCLIALIPLVFSWFALYGAIKYADKIGAHPQYLGANVAATILTPLLLGILIVVG